MKANSLFLAIGAALALGSCASTSAQSEPLIIANGEQIIDTEGNPVNCHGGGFLTVGDTTYWYGEQRPSRMSSPQLGVSCYSTTDFKHWTNRGIVLPVSEDAAEGLTPGCIVERPKVIYNDKTGKYVLWFHHELPGRGYEAAHCGVAVSDTPTGPFTLLRSSRTCAGEYPINFPDSLHGKHAGIDPNAIEWWTPEWQTMVDEGLFVDRDLEGGQMSRDMTLYVDEDGKAYHIYSSEENLTLHIAELTDDYTAHTGKYIRIFPGGHNEAPTIFKRDGEYWMITSGCTGWAPNKARMMRASDIMGEWTMMDDTPFVGEGADTTFGGQGTYIVEIGGQPVFVADIWKPRNLKDSRTLWLPIEIGEDGIPTIPYVANYEIKR